MSTTTTTSKALTYKLVLLGESAVGKSSLVLRFVRGQFFEYQESTIGGLLIMSAVLMCLAAFLTQTVPLGDATGKLLHYLSLIF